MLSLMLPGLFPGTKEQGVLITPTDPNQLDISILQYFTDYVFLASFIMQWLWNIQGPCYEFETMGAKYLCCACMAIVPI